MSRLFLDFLGRESLQRDDPERSATLARFYSAPAQPSAWMSAQPALPSQVRARVAAALEEQNKLYAAGERAFENIQRLRDGASVVVTGQQVGLFGGPLYALLKAATAIRLAEQASSAGHPAVPIFWMATEDHDFAEVDHVVLPERHALHTLRLERARAAEVPVGGMPLGPEIEPVLDQAAAILGQSAFTERLRHWYRPENTLARAFGEMMAAVFAPWGLIVMDAAGRELHQVGSEVFRRAVVDADALHHALMERNRELEAAGYSAQVKVAEGGSLLFLLEAKSGARLPLRRVEGKWRAGGRQFATEELLGMLTAEPERFSPNALLRPVFQDALLPSLAYVGGPAEIAYFAQSEVLYRKILGRVTPIVPRLSATLVEPAIATVMQRHELSFPDALTRKEELTQRLGARAMPIQGKRKLAAAGEALDRELNDITGLMASLDEGLGRAAGTAASKMRYQMNRLRRLAATHQLQQDASLARHATAVIDALYPTGHLQERVIGGAYFLARYGEPLVRQLVQAAGAECREHQVISL